MFNFVISVRTYDDNGSLMNEPVSGLLLNDWFDGVLTLFDMLPHRAVMQVYDQANRKRYTLDRSMSESDRMLLEYTYI